MPETLTKDDLQRKIIALLSKDDRTLCQLAQACDAVHILERPDAITGPNWEIARSVALARLPDDVRSAITDAEAVAQVEYRLALKPLGIQG